MINEMYCTISYVFRTIPGARLVPIVELHKSSDDKFVGT
jgi:hypothetical protein